MKLNQFSEWKFLGFMAWGVFAFWLMIGVVQMANSDGGSIASPWYWVIIGAGVVTVLVVGVLVWGLVFLAKSAVRCIWNSNLKTDRSEVK